MATTMLQICTLLSMKAIATCGLKHWLSRDLEEGALELPAPSSVETLLFKRLALSLASLDSFALFHLTQIAKESVAVEL